MIFSLLTVLLVVNHFFLIMGCVETIVHKWEWLLYKEATAFVKMRFKFRLKISVLAFCVICLKVYSFLQIYLAANGICKQLDCLKRNVDINYYLDLPYFQMNEWRDLSWIIYYLIQGYKVWSCAWFTHNLQELFESM